MEVSSEAKKGSEKDTFFKITSYIDFIGIFQEYGRDTGGSIRVILVLGTKVLSNLMRSIQNSTFRDLIRFHLHRICRIYKYRREV